MPFLFCPIGPSKSKKVSPKNGTGTTGATATISSNKSSSHGVDQDPQHATSSLLRIVTKEHRAQVEDELSVYPGELVLCEYSDGKWTNVTNLRTSQSGFVPDSILSDRCSPPRRKKLPRSESANLMKDHDLNHHDPSSPHLEPINDHQSKDLSSKSGDNIRLKTPLHHHHHHHHHHNQQQDDLVPASSIPQSIQGSSGKQSLPRFPDIMEMPAPCNMNIRYPNSHSLEHFEPNVNLFRRQNLGTYLVTHSFMANAENDLSVGSGDYVTLLNRDDKDWFWVRRIRDLEVGFVPATFMCRSEEARSILTRDNSIRTTDLERDFHTYINHPPDKESLATDQHSSSALVAS